MYDNGLLTQEGKVIDERLVSRHQQSNNDCANIFNI